VVPGAKPVALPDSEDVELPVGLSGEADTVEAPAQFVSDDDDE
jgi:hypothetical protein